MKREIDILLASAWLTLSPVHPILAMVLVLPIADLVLACVASWKTKKLPPHSHGIGRTLGKMTLYVTAVLLAFATQRWLTGDTVPCLTFITTLIGARELKSCLEHLDEISGVSLFQSAIERLVPSSRKTPPDGGGDAP